MHLPTPRLNLWPCTLDDVDGLLAMWREPLVRKYLLDDRVLMRSEVEQYVESFLASATEHGHYLWSIEEKGGEELIGFVAIRQIEGTPEVEVYYGLAPAVWGKGLATEAAQAVLEYGFDVLKLNRIWARTDQSNEASKRVARRLGMHTADDPGLTSLISFVIQRPALA